LVLALFSLVALACGASASTTTASSETAEAVQAVSAEPITAAPEPTSAPASQAEENVAGTSDSAQTEVEPTALPTATPDPVAAAVAAADTDLPQAPIGFDSLFETGPEGPQPISIEIENINVANADIIPVGVNEDLTFEVPPADQVGWYEFGSAPGEAGSAVLAAHIAYNGVDGVFRYLEDVEIGSVVIVGFDDGSSQRYRIEEVTEYVKEALPDSLFARDGKEQLALITCGGTFNYQLDSYESNTVAIAVPI